MPPLDGQDIWFRPLLPQGPRKESGLALPQVVGTFDPERLAEFDAASRLPLGTYGEPALAGADARSRALLDGGTLRPASSPTAHVQQPPLLLTSMASVQWLADAGYLTYRQTIAPVSAIRVRVAG